MTFPSLPLPDTLSKIAPSIADWAASQPLIDAVYLFGSRVRGTTHDRSDLDVALALATPTGGTPFDQFEPNCDSWRDTLSHLTGLDVDLKLASKVDHPQTWRFLKGGCACIYVRQAREEARSE